MDPQDGHSGEGRIDPTIGERVMIIRRRRGLSQRDLAARAQMSPTALNRLERGLQSVWAERLATLARILGVSADYLLSLQDEAQHASRDTPARGAPPSTITPVPAPTKRPRRRPAQPVG